MTDNIEKEVLEKRTHVFLQPPSHFEISGCSCGNDNTQWSEYVKHIWCDKCQIDFIPEHGGVFDGPIPVKISHMLGLSFDRLNLQTNQVEMFTTEGYYVKGMNFYLDRQVEAKKEITLKYGNDLIPLFMDTDTADIICDVSVKNGNYSLIIYTISVLKEVNEWKFELEVKNNTFKICECEEFETFKKFLLNQKLDIKFPNLKKEKPRKI